MIAAVKLPADKKPTKVRPIALCQEDAAMAIGISPRLLADMTKAGEVPFVRIRAKRIVYPVHLLKSWLTEQATQPAASDAVGEET